MKDEQLEKFKAAQKTGWASFHVFESKTTAPAGNLVAYAKIAPGEKVLDIGCGTGVVAVSAARRGAKVKGLDLTPALLEHARRNAKVARVDVEFTEGDAEYLPYGDGEFDVVVSQFGHMFAPRPQVAVSEMLRTLKPGGRMAFSTWPPTLYTGRMFSLVSGYLPLPDGVAPPVEWGDVKTIRDRLGNAVKELEHEEGLMLFPTLSPKHAVAFFADAAGPVTRVMEALKDEPVRLAAFCAELEALITEYMTGNVLEQRYLMTRAVKA